MIKFYFIFLLISSHVILAQDSLAKYTPDQLAYKASMATRHLDKPFLWKVYFNAMLKKRPSYSLRAETYYNLSWDLFRYTDYGLEFSIRMMKNSIYYWKKANVNEGLIYSYESLGELYTIKNDNNKALECLKQIKRLHNPKSMDYLSYLKFNNFRIYSQIGDFSRAISILLSNNRDIDNYISNNNLDKEIRDGLIYDKKSNYIRLTQCYNYQMKLDSSAYYIKKIREIEKQGYPLLNNYDWIEEAFYLVLAKKYDGCYQIHCRFR